MKILSAPLILCASVLLGSACSNIDCPLDNVVMMKCDLYASETQTPLTLAEVLTVTSPDSSALLLNQATNINTFLLPLKETGTQDTLVLHFSNSQGQEAADTLFITHTPQPHFESVDCPASVFHTLTAVRSTSHPLSKLPLTVDSVSLIRSLVNYDDIENIRIFLRSTSDH